MGFLIKQMVRFWVKIIRHDLLAATLKVKMNRQGIQGSSFMHTEAEKHKWNTEEKLSSLIIQSFYFHSLVICITFKKHNSKLIEIISSGHFISAMYRHTKIVHADAKF